MWLVEFWAYFKKPNHLVESISDIKYSCTHRNLGPDPEFTPKNVPLSH